MGPEGHARLARGDQECAGKLQEEPQAQQEHGRLTDKANEHKRAMTPMTPLTPFARARSQILERGRELSNDISAVSLGYGGATRHIHVALQLGVKGVNEYRRCIAPELRRIVQAMPRPD